MAIGLVGIALLIAVSLPSTAAATITVGSDLTGELFEPKTPSNCSPIPAPCTAILGDVHKGNAFPAVSPTSGTVTAFNIKTASAGTVTFRLGRVNLTSGDDTTVASATGPTAVLPGAGTFSFPAHLPIAEGEAPGIDYSSQSSSGACFEEGFYFLYSPPLVTGAATEPNANSTCELMVNVVVEPTGSLDVGALALNKARGTATLKLDLPGPGKLTVSGKGVKKISRSVKKEGKLNLSIVPTASTSAKLEDTGKAKVKLSIKFTPKGGKPTTHTKRIELIKN